MVDTTRMFYVNRLDKVYVDSSVDFRSMIEGPYISSDLYARGVCLFKNRQVFGILGS